MPECDLVDLVPRLFVLSPVLAVCLVLFQPVLAVCLVLFQLEVVSAGLTAFLCFQRMLIPRLLCIGLLGLLHLE